MDTNDDNQADLYCSQIWVSCYCKQVLRDLPVLALEELFQTTFLGQVVTNGQVLVLMLDTKVRLSMKFDMTIMDIIGSKDNGTKLSRGLIEKSTVIRVFPSDAMSSIVAPIYFIREGLNLNITERWLNNLGIAGMTLHVKTIVDGIFGSDGFRLPDSSSLRLADRKVKGVLLYGPSGTGKTLLASNIHRVLGLAEPKIIDYYKSKDLHPLFGEAVRDARINRFWRFLGRDATRNQLHLFILENIELATPGAMCEFVGNDPELVTLMDSLDNILIIATTSHIHQVHSLFLRRFELQIKLDHLNEAGRLDALKIFTRRLTKERCLKENELNLAEMASKTKGYRAEELKRLVSRALLIAMERVTEVEHARACITFGNIAKGTQVGMDDFNAAMEFKMNVVRSPLNI